MNDCVVDTAVVALANGDIAGRRPGNALDRRLAVIEQTVAGKRRLRYNAKLLDEYTSHVRTRRNDVVVALFEILDDKRRSVLVPRSSLSKRAHHTATRDCRWPSHDQHLLAAALGGNNPAIVVTEQRLNQCARAVHRHFRVRIQYVG